MLIEIKRYRSRVCTGNPLEDFCFGPICICSIKFKTEQIPTEGKLSRRQIIRKLHKMQLNRNNNNDYHKWIGEYMYGRENNIPLQLSVHLNWMFSQSLSRLHLRQGASYGIDNWKIRTHCVSSFLLLNESKVSQQSCKATSNRQSSSFPQAIFHFE